MQKWENVLLHLTSATATNNHPPPPSPPLFIFLLTTEEVLSFKLKYWANLLKLIYFLVFFLLFTFSLPCRKDQFAVLYFIQHVIVLIQVYNWEILQHRTQRFCRCGPVDISYFGRLSAGHKRIAFFSSLKQNMQVQLYYMRSRSSSVQFIPAGHSIQPCL